MNHYDEPGFFAAYSQMSRSTQGLDGAGEWHQLKKLFPDVCGKKVLDLGCGYGWHCRYAADNGAAEVLGIDASGLMLKKAEEINTADCITYKKCSIEEYSYPENTYDLVVSNLALHYVEDLASVYSRIWRTLKTEGIFLLNIEHPTFTAGVNQQFSANGSWPVNDYYYPGKRETMFLGHCIPKYHHTLTQIVGGLLENGFRLEALEEAMPPVEWRDIMPEEMRRPMMLLIRAAKE